MSEEIYTYVSIDGNIMWMELYVCFIILCQLACLRLLLSLILFILGNVHSCLYW